VFGGCQSQKVFRFEEDNPAPDPFDLPSVRPLLKDKVNGWEDTSASPLHNGSDGEERTRSSKRKSVASRAILPCADRSPGFVLVVPQEVKAVMYELFDRHAVGVVGVDHGKDVSYIGNRRNR
jgi:hypothetical protein